MIKREQHEIDELEYLKIVVQQQDELLMETKRTVQDLWRILDTASNPHFFGTSRSAWYADRDRAKKELKSLEVKLRSRKR